MINNLPWHFQHDSPNRMHFLIRQITRPPQIQDDVHFILVLSSKQSMCFPCISQCSKYQAMRINKLYIMWFNATDRVVRWARTTNYGLNILICQKTHRNMLVVHQFVQAKDKIRMAKVLVLWYKVINIKKKRKNSI